MFRLFNEGFYLHSRVTVNVFQSEAPVLVFNFVGWGKHVIFLAAMSSSRSDNVTKFFRPSGVNSFSLELSKHFKQECLRVCVWSFNGVPSKFQGSFKGVNKKFQGSLKGVVSRKFQKCFEEVSGKFQGCSSKIEEHFK